MTDLEALRRHYAEGLGWHLGVGPGRLVDAFERVPRERFLGPGPWKIMGFGAYRQTPDDDPRHVYHDELIALVAERRLNNGKPSFLAGLIRAVDIAEGEHVVHLGCGVGYYTAVMAELVGAAGRVTAIEADAALAARAVENLAERSNVEARKGDGVESDFDAADVIFVNFGMTHPLARWAERLKPNGRLLVAITAASGMGSVLCFQRRGDAVAARVLGPTQIFSSVSGRDSALALKLRDRFASNPMAAAVVASLRLDAHDEDDSCWLHGDGVCLSRRSVEAESPFDVYAGTYRIGPGADVTFSVRDGALYAQSPAGNAKLAEDGDDSFAAPGVARMRFVRDDAGLVTGVVIEMGEQRYDAVLVR